MAHSSLQRCSSLLRFVGICLYTALTTSFQDDVWTMTGLLQNLDSLLNSRSVVDLLVYLGSLSNFGPTLGVRRMSSFDSRRLWYTEEFMIDSVTMSTKQVQNHV